MTERRPGSRRFFAAAPGAFFCDLDLALDQATTASSTVDAVPHVPPRRTDRPGRIGSNSERTCVPTPEPTGVSLASLRSPIQRRAEITGNQRACVPPFCARDDAGFSPATAA
jgi:hypothetical protein